MSASPSSASDSEDDVYARREANLIARDAALEASGVLQVVKVLRPVVEKKQQRQKSKRKKREAVPESQRRRSRRFARGENDEDLVALPDSWNDTMISQGGPVAVAERAVPLQVLVRLPSVPKQLLGEAEISAATRPDLFFDSHENGFNLAALADETDVALDELIAHLSRPKNVAKTGDRDLDSQRTTCHWCRQSLWERLTRCSRCDEFGGKSSPGRLCGSCLLNRHAESIFDALNDPNWVCPYCRDLCDCSSKATLCFSSRPGKGGKCTAQVASKARARNQTVREYLTAEFGTKFGQFEHFYELDNDGVPKRHYLEYPNGKRREISIVADPETTKKFSRKAEMFKVLPKFYK